jgi:phage tail protein X
LLTYDRLDSRQRKKKHTEDLEEEKKAWTDRHQQLERDNEELRMRMEAMSVSYDNLRQTAENLQIKVHGLENEKEALINKNILETGELRSKITVLRDQLESSPVSHPTEYGDFTTDLEALTMGTEGEWASWVTEYPDVEQEIKPNGVETTLVVGQTRKDTHMSDMPEEKPSVGGKVLQLFTLVGALIAARPTTAPPTMPAEYQAEGQALVEHVLNANPGLQQASMALLPGSNIHWPQPSNTQGQTASAFSPQANAAGSSALTRRVLGQTKQQMAEAAFSMTAAQYQAITNADFSRQSYENSEDRPSAPTRKSLSELVRANREAAQDGGNTGEVYTRSLMWDRIPADVVQEFKRLVTENNEVKREYDE